MALGRKVIGFRTGLLHFRTLLSSATVRPERHTILSRCAMRWSAPLPLWTWSIACMCIPSGRRYFFMPLNTFSSSGSGICSSTEMEYTQSSEFSASPAISSLNWLRTKCRLGHSLRYRSSSIGPLPEPSYGSAIHTSYPRRYRISATKGSPAPISSTCGSKIEMSCLAN